MRNHKRKKGFQSMSSSSDVSRKEEIRGLFVLGLLAVLASIRLQNKEMIVTLGLISFDIIPLLDTTITLWSIYALFMVLGLSEDVIGKTLSKAFLHFSKLFLGLNFLLLSFFSILFYSLAFPTRFFWILVLFSLMILSCVLYYGLKKRGKVNFTELKKIVKSNSLNIIEQLTLMGLIICLMIIIFIPDEKHIPPATLLGFAVFLIILLIKDYRCQSE